jgi:hypothetical protein
MGEAAARAEAPAGAAEKVKLMKELNILTDRRDAIEAMIKARKTRLKGLMNDAGERCSESEWGTAAFKPKRSFTVEAPEKLSKFKKSVLIEGFKPSAKLVDALAKRGTSIKGIITVGVNETFEYSRPKGKEAEARRKEAVARSMQEAEAKVAEILERI